MKIIIAILILAGGATFFNACARKNIVYNEAVVLIDITDSINVPKVEDVTKRIMPGSIWDGVTISIAPISDLRINKNYEAHLEPINKLNGSEKLRKKEIVKFNNNVSTIIGDITNKQSEKSRSAVYSAIALKLRQLAKSPATNRTLIVISDMAENTDDVSFYRLNDLELLYSEPQAIIEKFEKISPLPDLTGIDIIVLYQPKNIKDDKLFGAVSALYQSMLESHHAKVKIVANL